ncbi:RHS repeat-associated core domain-containing protein [Pseudomonas sp. DTU_2021_1001937_2_SI_NGA_ILE_001]|uniref:RHS repeat-associated core domain-containing protein n=1 Tax=Pseudomonas sp. DTU_2021_1001937_2_SI_NGA_ILE_001 TaxID=3077589 RepID=UPI0028FC2C90|nr:RHS repeat-associated core domain-containing protein [Pseudomonas sp. DTU_2021_1001937_2_SI_NGA_ILE_001]WNW12395.1 RHS repeat-associated core domain-containing protein [Pseudomonas sp. DTU_2021_1001937_2_SI_NGA_ILE_001]
MATVFYRYDALDRVARRFGAKAEASRRPYQGLRRPAGFNGEYAEPFTGHYLLGNGYRAYNPVLMRFNSADSLSPFGEGGLGAYAYCRGDPLNRRDPSGHFDIGELVRDVLPYVVLVGSAVSSGMMYKLTKVRFAKWRAGTASRADKVMSVGAIGFMSSAAVAGAGGVARIADPQSDVGYVLGVLGVIAGIGFQGVRYTGYKMNKPVPRPVPKGLPVRRSLVERPLVEPRLRGLPVRHSLVHRSTSNVTSIRQSQA